MIAPTDDRATEVRALVEELLDRALPVHQDMTSGERFQECLLCRDWEGHTAQCPVPALQALVESEK